MHLHQGLVILSGFPQQGFFVSCFTLCWNFCSSFVEDWCIRATVRSSLALTCSSLSRRSERRASENTADFVLMRFSRRSLSSTRSFSQSLSLSLNMSKVSRNTQCNLFVIMKNVNNFVRLFEECVGARARWMISYNYIEFHLKLIIICKQRTSLFISFGRGITLAEMPVCTSMVTPLPGTPQQSR